MRLASDTTISDFVNFLNKNKEFHSAIFSNGLLFYKGSGYGLNLLKENRYSDINEIINLTEQFDYGIIVLIFNNTIYLFNDPYGAYPLFLNTNGNKTIVVDNINSFGRSMLSHYDELAIADYYLFHHAVGQNTLHRYIKRVRGNSIIKKEANGMIEVTSKRMLSRRLEIKKVSDETALSNHLKLAETNNIKLLTLTGGFDSRLLMSFLLSKSTNFETVTWGSVGNLQSHIAKKLSREFNLNHNEITLDDEFINQIPQLIKQIFLTTPDSPFILDMPQFLYYSDLIVKKYGAVDLITGFMGSELLRGPTYSSEVLLTKFIADLYKIKSFQDLKSIIHTSLSYSNLFNIEYINDNINALAERYVLYSSVGYERFNDTGQVNYLLNEKYGKMYSQIIRLHNKSINLINPYLNCHFINNQMLRNLKGSFYSDSKFKNFKSYRYYADLIRKVYPGLLRTEIDKGGFYLKDLLTTSGFMRILINKYILKRKSSRLAEYSSVINYSEWLNEMIKESFNSESKSSLPMLNYGLINKLLDSGYENLTMKEKNSFIVLGGINMFMNHVNNELQDFQ